MPKKSYEVIVVRKSSGRVTRMTEGHLTLKEAKTIASKLTKHRLTTIKVREV